MYYAHFGLNQSPFSITPNPAFFYSGNQRGDILDALIYAVSHGEGIIKVTGEVGSGKTMLCRMLEGMMPVNVEVIYLVNPTLSREEVMFTIAGELEIPTEGKRPDEVIRLLHQDLISKHIVGKQVVLLVEEAQAMPLETLEEIRLFSNLETAHHKLLQIVLFGQPELDENLNLPQMRQLKERITHSFTVPPMPAALMTEFLMFRMRAAGYHGPNVFTKGAIKLLASVSEGIVRRINILADKSLLAAFSDNTHAVEAKHVKAAINDSEFSSKKYRPSAQTWAIGILTLLVLTLSIYIAWKTLSPAPIQLQQTSKPKPQLTMPSAPLPQVEAQSTAISHVVASTASYTTPIIAVEKTPLANDLHQATLNSKNWLNDTPSNYYTIQLILMDANHQDKIEQFLKKAGNDLGHEQVFIYPSKLGGVSQFGIVYASFATRAEAWKKRLELAEKFAFKGQLRTIGGLRAEIVRTKSADLWRP